MDPSVTECNGLLVAGSKIDSIDTDGAAVAAGNSTFTLPTNFSRMTDLSDDATVEAAAQVIAVNPYRGVSDQAINTDLTSLSLLVDSRELSVHNLTSPIQIRIPIKELSLPNNSTKEAKPLEDEVVSRAKFASGYALNVSCSGNPVVDLRVLHQCPDRGPLLNYTCDQGLPYEITLTCDTVADHTCVFWDPDQLAWSSKGCTTVGVVATGIRNQGFILCNCTHLTDFSSQVLARYQSSESAPSYAVAGSIDAPLTSLETDLKDVLVLAVLVSLYGAIMIACIYSRSLDNADVKKVSPLAPFLDGSSDAIPRDFKKAPVSSILDVVEFVAEGRSSSQDNAYVLKPDALKALKKLLKYRSDHAEAVVEVTERNGSQAAAWREHTTGQVKLPPLKEFKSADGTAIRRAGKARAAPGSAARTVRGNVSRTAVVPFSDDPESAISEAGAEEEAEPEPLQVDPKALEVAAIQQLLASSKKPRGLWRGFLFGCWTFMKKKHQFGILCVSRDDFNGTRSQRTRALSLFFLCALANHCYLFVSFGNPSDGNTPSNAAVKLAQYVVVAAVCQAFLMEVLTFFLIFQRVSSSAFEAEDRWVGTSPSKVPPKVRRAVNARQDVLLALNAVRQASEKAVEGRLAVRTLLEATAQTASHEGRGVLTEDEALKLVFATQEVSTFNNEAKSTAHLQFERALERFQAVKVDHEKWVTTRVSSLLGSSEVAAGAKPSLWVRCVPFGRKIAHEWAERSATAQAKRDFMALYQSKKERALALSAKHERGTWRRRPMGCIRMLLGTQFVNPSPAMNSQLQKESPWWVACMIPAFGLGLGISCTYYTFLFSAMLSKCAECGPVGSSDDDIDDVDACSTCPVTMRENRSPQHVAVDWLLTFLYTLLFNMVVLQPLVVAVRAVRMSCKKYLPAGTIDACRHDSSDDDDDDDEDGDDSSGDFESGSRDVPRDFADDFLMGPREDQIEVGQPGRSRLLSRLAPLPATNLDATAGSARASCSATAGGRDEHESSRMRPNIAPNLHLSNNSVIPQLAPLRVPARRSSGTSDGLLPLAEGSGGSLATANRQLQPTLAPTKSETPKTRADGNAVESQRKREEKMVTKHHFEGSSKSNNGNHSGRSRSRSASRSRASGGGGAVQAHFPDLGPRWTCACGFTCKESSRRSHMGFCSGRNWESEFHALVHRIQQERGAMQEAIASGECDPNARLPLSIEQRLAALQKKVAHFAVKRSAAAATSSRAGGRHPGEGAASRATERTAAKWWDRGMLLAALVESNGDVRRAAARLCQGCSTSSNGGDKGGEHVLVAEDYRAEMRFVAESSEMAEMLAVHNELLEVMEFTPLE